MELKSYYAQDKNGETIPGAYVYLYQKGTTTLVSGLEDASGNALQNPFQADEDGLFQLAAPDGVYDLRVTGAGRDKTLKVQFLDATEALETIATSAERAESAENEAKAARDAALVAGSVYNSVADGEADKAEGEFFWVVSPDDDALLDLWRMGASSATYQDKQTPNVFHDDDTVAREKMVDEGGESLYALYHDGTVRAKTLQGERILNHRFRPIGDTETDDHPAMLRVVDTDGATHLMVGPGGKLFADNAPAPATSEPFNDWPALRESTDYAIAMGAPDYYQRTNVFGPEAGYSRIKNPNIIHLGNHQYFAYAQAQGEPLDNDPDYPTHSDMIGAEVDIDPDTGALTISNKKILNPTADPDGNAVADGYGWTYYGMCAKGSRVHFIAQWQDKVADTMRYFSAHTDDLFTTVVLGTEITSLMIPAPGYRSLFDNIGCVLETGPHAGRWLVSCYTFENVSGNKLLRGALLYSDDDGVTWQRGGVRYGRYVAAVDDILSVNEGGVSQLPDGRVIALFRTTGTHSIVCVSRDGGETFDESLEYVPRGPSGQLLEPGGVNTNLWVPSNHVGGAYFPVPKVLWALSTNYASGQTPDANRQNGALFLSYDDGRTFNHRYDLTPSYFGYSQPFHVGRKFVGVIFEQTGFGNATTDIDVISLKNLLGA